MAHPKKARGKEKAGIYSFLGTEKRESAQFRRGTAR
jgi:hypothetical protein